MAQGPSEMSAAMSPFMSGTSSPVPGGGSAFVRQQNSNLNNTQPNVSSSMALAAALQAAQSGQNSPALAYANAQLSQYAQQPNTSPQMPRSQSGTFANMSMQPPQPQQQYSTNPSVNQQLINLFSHQNGMPSHLHPQALTQALTDFNTYSVPNSAASSPGHQYRRLPGMASGYPSGTMTGHNTPGGNPRIAASAITGKRLNWSEMICQTIAESEHGRLVIQDLFEQMCQKFPEIHEWAFGKDWEARVKNRIKSTLSIKGNLFIKVPRPSSASGKGSWWTLSQEAQDAWKEGRVASVVKSAAHSRNSSQVRSALEGLNMSAATSRANSRAPSRRGSPVSSRGPSSQHANHANQHGSNRGGPSHYVNFGSDGMSQTSPGQAPYNPSGSSSSGSAGGSSDSRRQSPSSGLPANLGMSPINLSVGPNMDSSISFGMSPYEMKGDGSNDTSMRRNFGDNNDGSDPFGSMGMPSSQPSMSYMPSSSFGSMMFGSQASNTNEMSSYNPGNMPRSDFGGLSAAPNLGGPQSMPFPSNNAGQDGNNMALGNQTQPMQQGGMNSFHGDPTLGAFAGLDVSGLDGLNNPFGSMAGGYTLLGDEANGSGAQPTPIPGRNGTHMGNGNGQGSNSGGRTTPSANSFNTMNWFGGPSPADSTGSTSQFFAYTPAMNAADTAVGNTQGGGASSVTTSGSFSGLPAPSGTATSALGPIGGEGSRKRRDMHANANNSSSGQLGDFALSPTEGGQR